MRPSFFTAPSGEVFDVPPEGRLRDIRDNLSLAFAFAETHSAGGVDLDETLRHAVSFIPLDQNNEFIGVFSGGDQVETLSRAELSYLTTQQEPTLEAG